MILNDSELLQRYVHDRSEAAFAELVRRHIDLVYSSALRQVSGDLHAAQDVVQAVFLDLARKSARLTRHSSLSGWLYTSMPKFKIATGRPESRGTFWSTIDRFHPTFEGGTFRHVYEEAVVCDATNSGYLLKFEADGYAPYLSRFIAP